MVQRVPRVYRDLKVFRVHRVQLETQDPRVYRGSKVFRVLLDSQVTPDLLDPQD